MGTMLSRLALGASRLAVVLTGLCAGCSSDDTTSSPNQDGCGKAPYAKVTAAVTSFDITPAPIAGAILELSLCTSSPLTTDADGRAEGELGIGQPYTARVTADGFIPSRSDEQVIQGDFDFSGALVPTKYAALLPHYDASTPVILATVFTGNGPAGDTGPCSKLDGAVFSVVDHPEAIVTYYTAATIPQPDPTLTATTTAGFAEIAGLAAGLTVELAVSKPGCPEASFAAYPHTNKYTLEQGRLSAAPAHMYPKSGP